MLIALALQSMTVPADAAANPKWPTLATFSRAPALKRTVETVEVATASDQRHRFYRMRLTRHAAGRADEVRWTDSDACAAVYPVLQAMRALPLPHPVVSGMEPDDGEIVTDGVGYRLDAEVYAAQGAMTLRSNVGTPLAAWVDRSFMALERCWSPVERRMG